LAYHDHLTKLPNRLFVHEKLDQMISECKRRNEGLICLICDLDNFKAFNDSMGHEGGDRLLNKFVERLQPLLRVEDTMGRVGGDEFIIVAKTGDSSSNYALSVTERIFSALSAPIHLTEQVIYVTVSIGIALFPEDGTRADDVFKRAILALNNAEKEKGNSFRFYNKAMEIEVQRKISVLARIREDLEKSRFVPFYQPKVNLVNGRISGMEALARWHSNEGLVSPGEFIPIAEDSGLIVEISKQIYEKAFADTAALLSEGHSLKLSINLSPLQLQAPRFFEDFADLQQSSGLPPSSIELEMTESVFFENTERVQALLKDIAAAGFTVSIDDFGTGYSSLQYLKNLPLDTLKIDMSFVAGIGSNKDDEHLVRTIVLLAKQFGLQVVAEGIEKEVQADFLKALGCNDGQGYYYARPMDFESFRLWLVSAAVGT
jgi:diguanylate cyclase (GGDEF)-like protein